MNLLDDNIIVFILFIGFCFLYFHSKKRVTINESKNIYIKHKTIPEKELFIRSNIFKGQINNYVFKKGDEGLGYYLD